MTARSGLLGPAVVWLSACALLVSACAPVKLIEPPRATIGDAFSVDPQIRWASVPARSGIELWTVDGATLEALTFFKGVEDGQPLYRGAMPGGPEEDKRPKFRATMTPTDIAELFVDSYAMFHAQKIETTGLRPAKFGTQDGFRFEITWVTPGGLDMQTLVAGAVLKKRLYAVVYSGARLHYFPRYRETVENLLKSISVQ